MSNFLYPVINGVAASWADISVRLSAVDGGELIEMGDIVSIGGASSVEVGYQKEGGLVIKRTAGELSNEAKWVLYGSGLIKLLKGLRAKAPVRNGQRRLSLVHFNVTTLWTPVGSDDILERHYRGCRILSDSQDSAEGTEAERVEMDLNPLQIVRVIDGEEFTLL
jgi:hypothetical protein